jgi:3-hydroxyisobutyrate dehydrogenase-like beta-hydroxyacid dehydrogenase
LATIGIIGLGLMGGALAERLITQGCTVIGFDLDIAKGNALAEMGGTAVSSAAELTRASETLIFSLPTSEIVTNVLTELEPSLTGKTILDTTTGEPATMAGCGERLATIGCDYLDATIAGSSAQVRRGEAIVMLGGPARVAERCAAVVDSFSRRHFYVGGWGAGARMKLVVNLVLGLNRAVLAEGLAFARASEIDPRQALEILMASPAFSQVMVTKGERMLGGNFTPDARLSQHAKDVDLILKQGAVAGVSLPLSQLHRRLLDQLIATGWGDVDNSAIVRAFSESLDFPPKG